MNNITAIFFDLDGTLRHSEPNANDIFHDYAATLGLRAHEEDRIRAARWEYLYWASSPDLRDDLIAHSIDTENFWVEYTRRHLVALGATTEQSLRFAAQVSAHMGQMYKPENVVSEEVRRALKNLKEAGYTMAVVSNRDVPFHELLEKLEIDHYFDFSLAAGEVNSYKPDPGVFQHALDRAKKIAQESVYVGDNYYADVVGARRAGLQPVLYDPHIIFPESDCPSIRSFDELQALVEGL